MRSGYRACIVGTGLPVGPSGRGKASVRAAGGWSRIAASVALLFVAAVTGCAPVPSGTDGAAAPDAVFAPPTDPLAAFAERTAPGREGVVQLANGRIVRARVARVYAAASGRECREVMSGLGAEERAQLFCRGTAAEGGAWAEARPLLVGRRQP